MANIQDRLTKIGSPYSLNNGATPTKVDLQSSTLHNEYSINGTPNITGKPKPSQLDLDGKTPTKYTSTLI